MYRAGKQVIRCPEYLSSRNSCSSTCTRPVARPMRAWYRPRTLHVHILARREQKGPQLHSTAPANTCPRLASALPPTAHGRTAEVWMCQSLNKPGTEAATEMQEATDERSMPNKSAHNVKCAGAGWWFEVLEGTVEGTPDFVLLPVLLIPLGCAGELPPGSEAGSLRA